MYYCVVVKCGHVGRNRYVLKELAIDAENGKEAAKKARLTPRVKHHHKDAIREVVKISKMEYLKLKDQNSNDNYFKCQNVQQQRLLINFSEEELFEEVIEKKFYKEKDTTKKVKMTKILDEDARKNINCCLGVA